LVNLKKPWLSFSAKVAHDLSIPALKVLGAVSPPQTLSWSSFDWRGLHFANRLGPSGGTDKNAELIKAWWALGAGFVEVGTITPEPQTPNPGTILDRDTETLSVWNKMGFPNKGPCTH
jgi:dihydroorotate dehydrogenase